MYNIVLNWQRQICFDVKHVANRLPFIIGKFPEGEYVPTVSNSSKTDFARVSRIYPNRIFHSKLVNSGSY